MNELPDSLYNALVDGLTLLLALRLPGAPAADTAQATAQAWSVALAANKQWDAETDLPRIRTAFAVLAANIDRWPAPRHLLDCLPPPPERIKLEHKHQPSETQKAAAAAVMAEIKSKLANAPIFNRGWMQPQTTKPMKGK